ncbi:MAG: ABC transporter ATP-binding protein/permease [Bacilli bacterium]|nr:ABC transporter ATP-binding protein/permease [Bacilli bacterium]
MLELKNISKSYKVGEYKQQALDDVSINFRKNEFASILGPSGSGKTTLLNIIGGLDKYDSGDLKINEISTKKYTDRDWDSYRNHRIGFVFQSYNLISHQSILANVELALTLSGVSKKTRRKKAIEMLEKVGLKEHIHKLPNQISGGQMQRVAIARALINDPDILLADEPTGALDTKTSKQIMELLQEIAKDKLVIMVTHNSDIANKYSTRIINLQDGKITGDSNPYDGKVNTKEKETLKKTKTTKTSMSFFTAISLSFKNLMTKKGRTVLTAFAGSIGIIGIALILSLANGINSFIAKTEEDTLSQYPLNIEKESVDMSSMIQAMAGSKKAKNYKDKKIHSINIMGDMFESMSSKVKHNNMEDFKKYIEKTKDLKKYTSDIKYSYNVPLNLYKNNPDKVERVNPTTVLDTIGMNTNGISSLYNNYLTNYDVFFEMLDNKELLKKQYKLVDGKWPTKYNEVILFVGENNEISDYTLYSLGILDQAELKDKFNKMAKGEKVSFKNHSYNTDELVNLTFKLVLPTSLYEKKNGIWINQSDNKEYMKHILSDAEEIKIVGIVKPSTEKVADDRDYGLVGYTHELMTHLIDEINTKDIVKEQKANQDINVFTGTKFTTSTDFDMSNLSPEQLMALQSMSEEELANYMKDYSENMNTTYEENLIKLGIADINNPDKISIYPKDFDSKEEIINIIKKYNKGKKEKDRIEYTDLVGVMMSSITTIINVISSVLIAFVAISLVVSSIMISIITYISVLERTKEIGILRALGASKKDISRVFNAETLVEGLAAGILGIIVTILLNIPINIIIKNAVDISNISVLPVDGAIALIIISAVLTVIAGLIPARIASRKDPVVALRTE